MNEISERSTLLDALYGEMKKYPEAEMPIHSAFLPGIYVRQIFMPAGTLVISRIHKYEHPFTVSKGQVSVRHQDGTVVHISAPYSGITPAGTQRILYMHSDTIWTTMHRTDLTDPDAVVEEVTQVPDEGSITISDEAMKQLKEIN